MQTLPLGDGHSLVVDSASEGWTLDVVVGEHSSGVAVVTPVLIERLMNRGATVSQPPVEVRGLRWEIEFRVDGQLIGRIRKEDFARAVSCVTPG